MRKSKFSPTQIANILKEFDLGKIVEEIIRNQSVSSKEFKRTKDLEEENILCNMGIKSSD